MLDRELVDKIVASFNIPDFSWATIREIKSIAARAEAAAGVEYIKLEMGVPGLPPSEIGVKAEIEALQKGVAGVYPDMGGMAELKRETSRFLKAFVGIDLAPAGCVPVVGSMQGSYASFVTCSQTDPVRDTILFIDPGFPVQKIQTTVMGVKADTFDLYEHRGEKLRAKLEERLAQGNVAAIVYSNPNNPAWVCLREEELQTIGELCQQHDVIVIEDLAYFAMDFRHDLSTPFAPPYQPSVARYCDKYILLVSASKAFSYAGQRIGVACISDTLFDTRYEGITARYGGGTFGSTFIHRVLYGLSAGVSHSAQYALAAMFRAASDGAYNFLGEVKEYGRRAQKLKSAFLRHGFHLVYDNDMGEALADGFYFTAGYGEMKCGELVRELLYYGISAIPLCTTGSGQCGIRACSSWMRDDLYDELERRLAAFEANHKKQ
jgi:aspartate/methionine/tyrosine aminotransferase